MNCILSPADASTVSRTTANHQAARHGSALNWVLFSSVTILTLVRRQLEGRSTAAWNSTGKDQEARSAATSPSDSASAPSPPASGGCHSQVWMTSASTGFVAFANQAMNRLAASAASISVAW